MEKKVNTALIASGSGTDAYSIMSAYGKGEIPNINLKLLISTKNNAGCLEKAKNCGIPAITIDRKECESSEVFNRRLGGLLGMYQVKLVFLVGCIVKIKSIEDINIYNIHPADTENCGGIGMYGLKPHKKVLTDIADLISRGKKTMEDKFYTTPTVHEVEEKYDSGQYLLKLNVEIPQHIIFDFIQNQKNLEDVASELQQHVLPYEWMILPTAVKVAAKKILEK